MLRCSHNDSFLTPRGLRVRAVLIGRLFVVFSIAIEGAPFFLWCSCTWRSKSDESLAASLARLACAITAQARPQQVAICFLLLLFLAFVVISIGECSWVHLFVFTRTLLNYTLGEFTEQDNLSIGQWANVLYLRKSRN